MKDSCIDICGITPESKLSKISMNDPFSEICETHKLYISKGKPNIEKILQLFIDTSIKEIKFINTFMGKKLIVEGILHIKVFYVTDMHSENIYFVYSDIPIYTFLTLDNIYKSIADINIFIEDATIHKVDSKTISVSCLMLICPLLKKGIDFDDTFNKNKENQWKCNDKEKDINISFQEYNDLECNIEYDMNSDASYKNYCIGKKRKH